MEADILIVVFLAAAFLLGVIRGALRKLIAAGGWLVSFIVAAYLRGPLGDWISAQGGGHSRVHEALDHCAIVHSLGGGSRVPGLISLLGPLLPGDVRAVYR